MIRKGQFFRQNGVYYRATCDEFNHGGSVGRALRAVRDDIEGAEDEAIRLEPGTAAWNWTREDLEKDAE